MSPTRRSLSVAELPPKPDPVTGLPRPPHAPGFFGQDTPAESDTSRERDPSLRPEPPEGQGPVLTWYHTTKSSGWYAAIGAVILLVGLECFINGVRWLTELSYWPMWAIVLLVALYAYFRTRGPNCSAGADWLARNKKWVRTYELAEILARSTPNGVYLRLVDHDGRALRYPLSDFGLDDRLLWDLTYNGILHSVIAGGARTNALARRSIALPSRASGASDG